MLLSQFQVDSWNKDSRGANVKWKYLFLKYNLTYFKVMTAFDIFITSGSEKWIKKKQQQRQQQYVHVLRIYR